MKTGIIAGSLLAGLLVGYVIFGASSQRVNELNSKAYINSVVADDYLSVRPEIINIPRGDISPEEKNGLLYMREEEKLARDVYTKLYEKWGAMVFRNIAQSEQTHTEAVRELIVKYGISDPVVDDNIGVFTNPDLKKLYDELVTKGLASQKEAFIVGVTIEDLDIRDLEREISKTDNTDIKYVYENLMRGSRNHMRAFVRNLSTYGVTYEPQYITRDEYNSIISSSVEMGGMMNGGMMNGWGRGRF